MSKFAVCSVENGVPKVVLIKNVLEEPKKGEGELGNVHENMDCPHQLMWATTGNPGDQDVSAPGLQQGQPFVDLEAAPGASNWWKIFIPPNVTLPLHRTDTIDYDTVLTGEVTLLLENSEEHFTAGDSIVMFPVVHGWRGGPEGAYLTVLNFGIKPSQR